MGTIALVAVGVGLLGYMAWRLVATATARLLAMPLGPTLVVCTGIGVLGYAAYQLYRAFSERAKRHLDLAQAGPTAATWIVRLGRFGIAARAVVFAMIGVFLIRAGMHEDSGEASGIAQSLRALGSTSHGRIVLSLVAFGLMSYGIYQLATARYRHMRAVRG